jgi:V8-like Glu-specific endopeptidase
MKIKFFEYLCLIFLSQSVWSLTNSTIAQSPSWEPVVQIRSDAPDSSGENIPGFCNGTFITKNIIATAAHCVKLAYISKDNLLQIQIGHYKYITKSDGKIVRIGYVPKYQFNKNVNIELPKSLTDKIANRGEKAQIGPDEDFALLWWNDQTPETNDLTPVEVVNQNEHNEIVKKISNFHFTVTSINLFSEASLDTKRMGELDNFKWKNGYIYSKSKVRVEEGDSGSPLFVKINDKFKLFGVVKGKASTVIDNWDVYPSMTPHLCDLNSRMPSDFKLSICLK